MQTPADANTIGASEIKTSSVVTPAPGRRNILVALSLFVLALVSLWSFEVAFHINPLGTSQANYFVFQAEGFLHGQWNLNLPSSLPDIAVIHGKHYIVYPPMPAVVLLPFVLIFGVHTSDILFTAVCSALNLSLLYLLLEQVRVSGFTRRIWIENACIGILLWYGSINLFLSLGGKVWFTSQILCMTFTLLALLAAFRRRFALSAILFGCAFFCRPPVALGYPFLFYLAWQDGYTASHTKSFLASVRERVSNWKAIPWRRLAPLMLIFAGVLLIYMVRNSLVFGSPLSTGYEYLIQQKYPALANGGLYNISYVPSNIVANFFSFPVITFTGPYDRHPVFNMDNNGIAVSIFVTTPLFLFLFWRNRAFSATRAALWVTIGLFVVETLLFSAAGYLQFGARYLYDGYPFVFLLLALTDVRIDWRFAALGLLAIVINILGALQFWTGIMPRL